MSLVFGFTLFCAIKYLSLTLSSYVLYRATTFMHGNMLASIFPYELYTIILPDVRTEIPWCRYTSTLWYKNLCYCQASTFRARNTLTQST